MADMEKPTDLVPRVSEGVEAGGYVPHSGLAEVVALAQAAGSYERRGNRDQMGRSTAG